MYKKIKTKANISTIVICAVIFIGFASVCYEIIAKNIIYDIIGYDSEWFLNTIKTDDSFFAPEHLGIDWSAEYPFHVMGGAYYQRTPDKEVVQKSEAVYKKFEKLDHLYSMLKKYTNEYFVFIGGCEFISKQFSNFAGNRLTADAYGMKQLFLSNRHMTYERTYKAVDDEAYNIINFADWLQNRSINYLHVVIPSPVSPAEELSVRKRGYEVYSNQMADEFIEALEHKGINCADLRRSVMKDDTLYTEYFFKYEHHMVPKAGLAAAKEISKCIDDIMDTSEDASIFDIGNYSFTEYIQNKGLMNDRLLVYEGKESMDLFHPLYETDFVKYVADYGLTITGTFDEVMYALWELPAYNTWNHGIKAVKTYRNRMIDGKQPKILLLTDSYSDVISPFLSCAYADIDEIDLRIFNGSLQKYIEETEPDLVVSIYSAYDFNSRGAESLFDFR